MRTPRPSVGPRQINGRLRSQKMFMWVCVSAGADITRSLIRLDESQKPMFFSCGCSRHHHHPPPHVLELLNRCTARQMWLNLAVCILSPCLFFFFFSPCSWAIRGARVGKQAHSHYVVFVNVCECVPR